VWTLLACSSVALALGNLPLFRRRQFRRAAEIRTRRDDRRRRTERAGRSLAQGTLHRSALRARLFRLVLERITPEGPKGPQTNNAQISRSLWSRTIKVTDFAGSHGACLGARRGTGQSEPSLRGANASEFHEHSRKPESGHAQLFFLVAADQAELEKEVSDFNGTLFWSSRSWGSG